MSGWVPSVLYGAEPFGKPQNLQVETKELRRHLREAGDTFENQTVNLTVGDKTHLVVPRQLQVHPVSERIMSLNFILYKEGMSVDIPLRTINEDQSPAIRRGAFFLQVSRHLKCTALSPDIPAYLAVDLAGAPNKTVIRMDRVKLPSTVVPLSNNLSNFSIGTIVGKRLSS